MSAPRRTALVTGGSSGIGLAVVRALSEDGWAITAVARDATRLAAAIEAVPNTAAHVADAGDGPAIARAVEAHVDRHDGALDLVVAGAGTGSAGRAASTSPEALHTMTHLNLGGPFALAAAAIPSMRRTDGDAAPAWFVVIASLSAVWPTPGFAAYSATKAAAMSLARSIAAEEADNGVRACAICPAFVDTDMAAWAKDRIDGDMLRPEDVAESVRFLTRLSPTVSLTELVLRRAGAGPNDP